MSKKSSRAAFAGETVEITKAGQYRLPSGRAANIAPMIDICLAGSRLVLPDDPILATTSQNPPTQKMDVEVASETTLAATRRLWLAGRKVVALNFASARNPGGGFLGGSQAQEESLARSSALYASLLRCEDFYRHHRGARNVLYSHRIIVSPECPVFRDDDGILLEEPYPVTFLTAAAPNAGAVRTNQPQDLPRLPQVFQERAQRVLTLAASLNPESLVLGAWGCGVFQNDPAMVAKIFADALVEPFAQGLRGTHIVFAVHDSSPEQTVLRAFQMVFKSSPPLI